ncbi:unnamed protein product [Rotaria socialis]|uniref:Potassium voltage-gated channel subfamily H member 2 n=7 Tax=Rotaria TaxID=231623 RepID=A0A817TT30_9BILA|nr:unnamed protein product [Rotaria socialis]CAF4474799.1 unnamed protein product [Rotaria socialis]
MPMKRGHVSAPQNTFIDTIIRKFDSQNRRFLISNAQLVNKPIIYCNDAFCELTGYSRSDILRKPCSCEFLYGHETDEKSIKQIRHALQGSDEKEVEIVLYKTNGIKLRCSVLIAPVKNESCDIILFILEFTESSDTNRPRRIPKIHEYSISPTNGIRKRSWLQMFNPLRKHKSLPTNDLTTGDGTDFESRTSSPDTAGYIALNHKNTTTIHLDETTSAAGKNFPIEYKLSQQSSICSNNLLKPDSNPWGSNNNNDADIMRMKSQSISNIAETVIKKETKESKKVKRSFLPNLPRHIAQILSLGDDIVPDFRLPDSRRIPRTIILHYSPFKAAWDWLILLLVIYTAIVTPYIAAFLMHEDGPNKQRSRPSRALSVIELIVDVMFIIDLLVNLRTTYVKHNEELVTRASKIAKHYLKGWFLIDVTAAIPFDILFSLIQTKGGGESTVLMGLLKTARLLRLVRIARKLDRYSEYGIGVLILLTATFALIAHWLACIWYAIGRLERNTHGTERTIGWLAELANHTHQYYNDSDPTSGPTKVSKYITALYFTFSSLTSVGFGNVSPNTNSEKGFSIIIMLVGCELHFYFYFASFKSYVCQTIVILSSMLCCPFVSASLIILGLRITWLDELARTSGQAYNCSRIISTNDTVLKRLNSEVCFGGPNLRSRYITALYFTFSSLTSVGFGNVSPNTNMEKIFSIFVMLIGSLMYASIFGNVSAIIQRLYSGTARYQIQMLRVKEFIRFHQIPNPLRQRLEDYFNHAWNYTNGIDMNMVLKGFPECLQADICLHLNSVLLKNCPAFKDASEGCLRTFSMKLKTTHAPPGDIITHRGDILTSLYFISRGSIEILKDDNVVAILSKDDILGENPVLYNEPGKSAYNVRALTYCDLHKILRDDLLEVIDMYPEFAQSFCENLKITLTLRDEDLVSKSNECRSKYLPNPKQYRTSTSLTKLEDDAVSIMAPHQSYFDEYPSGTGKLHRIVIKNKQTSKCDI